MTDTLLLVEDDPGSQELVRALCTARGFSVDVAGDGFLGLRLLSERRHAIVLIDYHLPEMDGYALARLMREVAGREGTVKLVGITADRHGLASRRGADALFDAILIKPLDPDLLYATLDRLSRPADVPAPTEAASPAGSQAADALWRRRGLPGRPRAVLCPDLGPEASAAVGQAFDLCSVESAELILVGAQGGLDGLRRMRTAGPGRFLPAVDLTGRLGPACDAGFRVDDAESWTRLAGLCRAFAERRKSLSAVVRDAADPATRLLAFLHIGDRALSLSACSDASAAITETGLSRTSVMAAILSLTGDGLAVCDPAKDGVVIRLTEAGRAAATQGGGDAAAQPLAARTEGTGERPIQGTSAERRRGGADPHLPDPGLRPSGPEPFVDAIRLEQLRQLIGNAAVDRLYGDFLSRIGRAFPDGATRAADAREAHALIAMAGSLGFARLSSACRDLESRIATGSDYRRELEAVQEIVTDVLASSQGYDFADAQRG